MCLQLVYTLYPHTITHACLYITRESISRVVHPPHTTLMRNAQDKPVPSRMTRGGPLAVCTRLQHCPGAEEAPPLNQMEPIFARGPSARLSSGESTAAFATARRCEPSEGTLFMTSRAQPCSMSERALMRSRPRLCR